MTALFCRLGRAGQSFGVAWIPVKLPPAETAEAVGDLFPCGFLDSAHAGFQPTAQFSFIEAIPVNDDVVQAVYDPLGTAALCQPFWTADSGIERFLAWTIGWPGEEPCAERETLRATRQGPGIRVEDHLAERCAHLQMMTHR